MPYIGHSPTNAGNFYILDDFNGLGYDGSSAYDQNANGSITAFKLMVAGVAITPNVDNLIVTIDGVLQHPTDAYSISGSILTFTEAPASGVDFHVVIMGQSATVGEGSIGADELEVSGDCTNNQLLKSDGDGTFSWINQNTVTASTANVATHVTVVDNENTNENNLIPFVEDASGAGNVGLESDGDLHYNPSTGKLTATQLAGTLQTAAQTNITSVGTLTSLTGGTGDLVWDTTTLVVDSSANSVGIGTAPSYMLEVNGSQSGNYVAVFENTHATDGYGILVKAGDDDNVRPFTIRDRAGTNLFWVKGAGETYINGSVGIGTDSPGAPLTITSDGSGYGGTYGHLQLTNTSYSASSGAQISFQHGPANNTYASAIRAFATVGGATHGGSLAFLTDNTGGSLTERMRIDSSGNVGIAQDSPTETVHIGNGGGGNYVMIQNASSGDYASGFKINRGVSGLGMQLYDNPYDGITTLLTAGGFNLNANGGGMDFKIDTSGNASFAGKVEVGTTTGMARIQTDNDADNPPYQFVNDSNSGFFRAADGQPGIAGYGVEIARFIPANNDSTYAEMALRSLRDSGQGCKIRAYTTTDSSDWAEIIFGRAGSSETNIQLKVHAYQNSVKTTTFQYTGNVYNPNNSTAWQTTSDIRIKKDINDLTGAVDILKQIRPVSFKYKKAWTDEKGLEYGNVRNGFIANEYKDVFPNAVKADRNPVKVGSESYDDFLSLDTEDLVPYLVKAVQELSDKLDTANAKITALENA